jgi:hypothetical protein
VLPLLLLVDERYGKISVLDRLFDVMDVSGK